jgi:hypothetical protein
VIFDHCDFGWSGEENITMYDNRYTTLQWCIMHDALYNDGHGKGDRSYGSQTGGICATYHHNLWTNNKNRSPRLNGARTDNETNVFIEFINNVVYNWVHRSSDGGDYTAMFNMINNYYKPGPATPKDTPVGHRILKPEAGRSKLDHKVYGRVYADGKKANPTIQVIDWETPENNRFHFTEEMEIDNTHSTGKRIPDIVCFVNGLPWVVIEAKRPDSSHEGKPTVSEGISQNIRNQKVDEIPHLFCYTS